MPDISEEFEEFVRDTCDALANRKSVPWIGGDESHIFNFAFHENSDCDKTPLDYQLSGILRKDIDRELMSKYRGCTLVSVCGTTPQPILLTAAALNPPRLLLLHTFESKHSAVLIHDAVSSPSWLEYNRCQPLVTFLEYDATDTIGQFQKIAAKLHDLGLISHSSYFDNKPVNNVVIDVTGGKKSMVAAAYLLSAEYGIPAVYIDGEYVDSVGLPKPQSLELVPLPDPASALSLRTLREVRTRTERHDYEGARETLDDVLEPLQKMDLAWPSSEGIRRLHHYLAACEAWEAGLYAEAKRRFDQGGWTLPVPVATLAAILPQDPAAPIDPPLADNPQHLATYLVDAFGWLERKRSSRRPNQNYLLAFALGEMAMRAFARLLATHGVLAIDGQPIPRERIESVVEGLDGIVAALLLNEGRVCQGLEFWPDQYATRPASLGNAAPPGPAMVKPERLRVKDGKKSLDGALSLPSWAYPIEGAAFWVDERWRDRRNRSAHSRGFCGQEEAKAMLELCRALIESMLQKLASLPNMVAPMVNTDSLGFAPKGFDALFDEAHK